jgi:hypothetical protein
MLLSMVQVPLTYITHFHIRKKSYFGILWVLTREYLRKLKNYQRIMQNTETISLRIIVFTMNAVQERAVENVSGSINMKLPLLKMFIKTQNVHMYILLKQTKTDLLRDRSVLST